MHFFYYYGVPTTHNLQSMHMSYFTNESFSLRSSFGYADFVFRTQCHKSYNYWQLLGLILANVCESMHDNVQIPFTNYNLVISIDGNRNYIASWGQSNLLP